MEPNRVDIDIVNQSCRIYQAVDFKGYSVFLFSFILNSCTEEFLLEEIILPYNIKYPTDSSETPREFIIKNYYHRICVIVCPTKSEDMLVLANYDSLKNQITQLIKIKDFSLTESEKRFISILPVETAFLETYKTINSWYKETKELNRIQNI